MKRNHVMFLLILLVVASCTAATVVKIAEDKEEQVEPVKEAPKPVASEAEFKIIQHYGNRNPASINGTVTNIGEGSGDVIITVSLYHSQKIVGTVETTIEDIAKDENVKFGMEVDNDLTWAGYEIVAKKVI